MSDVHTHYAASAGFCHLVIVVLPLFLHIHSNSSTYLKYERCRGIGVIQHFSDACLFTVMLGCKLQENFILRKWND